MLSLKGYRIECFSSIDLFNYFGHFCLYDGLATIHNINILFVQPFHVILMAIYFSTTSRTYVYAIIRFMKISTYV